MIEFDDKLGKQNRILATFTPYYSISVIVNIKIIISSFLLFLIVYADAI